MFLWCGKPTCFLWGTPGESHDTSMEGETILHSKGWRGGLSQAAMFWNWSLDFRIIKAGTKQWDPWDWLLSHGSSQLPLEAQLTLNPESLPSNRPQAGSPCHQSADLAIAQRMCKWIWARRPCFCKFLSCHWKIPWVKKNNRKGCPIVSIPQGLSFVHCTVETRKPTQIPFVRFVPNGIKVRNISLEYILPETWHMLLRSLAFG